MFLLRKPSSQHINRFLAVSRQLSLSYSPVGLAREPRPGFMVDELVAVLGHGEETFERAKRGLMEWKQFQLGWVELFPPHAPLEPGTTVAVCVNHLGFWSLNGCRVVYSIRADREFGFAYGTLAGHAESGEEIFKVNFEANGDVTYTIRAVARARAPLAKLGYPFTRALQSRFRRDSARALQRAVEQS